MLPATKFEENLLALEQQKCKTFQNLEIDNYNFIKQSIEEAIAAGKTKFDANWFPQHAQFRSDDFPSQRTKEQIIFNLNKLGYWACCHTHVGHCTYHPIFYWTHKKPSWLSKWWNGWQEPTSFGNF